MNGMGIICILLLVLVVVQFVIYVGISTEAWRLRTKLAVKTDEAEELRKANSREVLAREVMARAAGFEDTNAPDTDEPDTSYIGAEPPWYLGIRL